MRKSIADDIVKRLGTVSGSQHVPDWVADVCIDATAEIERLRAAAGGEAQMIAMVDRAMVEMGNINPPLRRSECERLIRAALAGRERGGAKPAAWLHTLHMEHGQTSRRLSFDEGDAFGEPGRDYGEDYEVTSEPLFKEE